MIIVIPTRGRWNEQITLSNIPIPRRNSVLLVVRPDEWAQHSRFGPNVMVLPEGVEGIAATRDWIIDKFPTDLICMLDDDLRFFSRREDDRTKFQPATPDSLETMFQEIEDALQHYGHVSIAPREGANRNTNRHIFNTRTMRVLAYDAALIKKHNLKFGPATLMCDFHMGLSLLELGFSNVVLNYWCNDQKTSNAPGGCSTPDRLERQADAARWLAEHHAPHVKLVTKQTKTAWGGKERIDVVIQWKKAYG